VIKIFPIDSISGLAKTRVFEKKSCGFLGFWVFGGFLGFLGFWVFAP